MSMVIKQVTKPILSSNLNYKKWYVARNETIPSHSTNYTLTEYLHKDGIWRTAALDNTKEAVERYTGYFDTPEEAATTLLNYLLQPNLECISCTLGPAPISPDTTQSEQPS